MEVLIFILYNNGVYDLRGGLLRGGIGGIKIVDFYLFLLILVSFWFLLNKGFIVCNFDGFF